VVRALGVVPLMTAVRIAQVLDARVKTSSYRASQALEEAGVLRRKWVRADLKGARVPGIGIVLVPGPEWTAWHERRWSLALGDSETATPDTQPTPIGLAAPDRRIREQLALATEVLRRIAGGWQLASGDKWLEPAVEVALRKLPATDQAAVALSRVQRSRRLTVPSDRRLVGMLPPEGAPSPVVELSRKRRRKRSAARVETALPCVIVGGGWSSRTDFSHLAQTIGYAAPYEVLATNRGERDTEQLRRLIFKNTNHNRGYCPLTSVRISQFSRWNAIATGLDDTLRTCPVEVLGDRLRQWLTLTLAP
jgi:hypothetical protein